MKNHDCTRARLNRAARSQKFQFLYLHFYCAARFEYMYATYKDYTHFIIPAKIFFFKLIDLNDYYYIGICMVRTYEYVQICIYAE